jgi:hypothetical protein
MSLTAKARTVSVNGGSIVVISLSRIGLVPSQGRWHSQSNTFDESVLPRKANRSRGRGAKPQVRGNRSPDGWVAEERASVAPGEQQTVHIEGGHFDVRITG